MLGVNGWPLPVPVSPSPNVQLYDGTALICPGTGVVMGKVVVRCSAALKIVGMLTRVCPPGGWTEMLGWPTWRSISWRAAVWTSAKVTVRP